MSICYIVRGQREILRQDLICMGADAIYKNRPYNVEFLDNRLRMKGNENILQQNLFIVLSSLEMIAVARFFSFCMSLYVLHSGIWLGKHMSLRNSTGGRV